MSIGNAGSNTNTANTAEVSNLLVQGFKAAKEGRRDEAYDIFCDVVKRDPNNELGWLYRAATTQDLSEAYVCLQRVLNINPANEKAQRGVERIQNRLSAEPHNRQVSAANGGAVAPVSPAITEREVISGFNPGFSRTSSAAPEAPKNPGQGQGTRYPFQEAPSPFNQAAPSQVGDTATPPPYRPNFGQYDAPGAVGRPATGQAQAPRPPLPVPAFTPANYVPAGEVVDNNEEELVDEPVQNGPVGSQRDNTAARRAGLVSGLAAARQRGRAAFGTDTPTDLDRNGQRRSRQILIPLVILGIVLVIVALLVLLLPSITKNSNDTATSINVAAVPPTSANTPVPTSTPGGRVTTAAAAVTVPVVGVTTAAATTVAATTAPATTAAPSPTAVPPTTAPATTAAPTPPPPTATQAPPPATTAPAAPALPRAAVYVIKGGDNLTRIATQYSTSIEAIQAANPGLQANTIFAGNRIVVPVSRPDFRGRGAIIGPNETLQTIADRFKVNVNDLARFNGYASAADAKPGDAVLIP